MAADLSSGTGAPWSFWEWAGTVALSVVGGAFGFGWRVRAHGQKIKDHSSELEALKAFRLSAEGHGAALEKHAAEIKELQAFRLVAVQAQSSAPTREQIREDMHALGRLLGGRFDSVERRLDGVDERIGRLDERVDQAVMKR